MLDYLADSLDLTNPMSFDLSNYLKALSRLIQDTILHLNRSGLNFSQFEKEAGFVLDELKNTSMLIDNARILVVTLLTSDRSDLKNRQLNIQKESKKLNEKSAILSKISQSSDSKSTSIDLRKQGIYQLAELRKGKVTDLIPLKQPIQVKKENENLIHQETVNEVLKLIAEKQEILNREEKLIAHRLELLPEFPSSSNQVSQVITHAQQENQYHRDHKFSFLNTKSKNIFDLKNDFNPIPPRISKKKNNHSLDSANERIEKIKDLMNAANASKKRIELAIELFGTPSGDDASQTEKTIEINFKELVITKTKITQLAAEIFKKIKKYEAFIKKHPANDSSTEPQLITTYKIILIK